MDAYQQWKKRTRLDLPSIAGLIAGSGIITAALVLGPSLEQFVSIIGLLIVVGGTAAVTFIKFPFFQVLRSLHLAALAFTREQESPVDLIRQTHHQARLARHQGLLALEQSRVSNRFFRKGLDLCADGYSAEYIRRILMEDMALTLDRHETGQRIFRSMAESAPAFGIIGTLVGLIQMLGNMDDPSAIGPAMALALLTTLYGALIANLICTPIADKLEMRTLRERINKALIIEGISSIQMGQHPRMIEQLLEAYVPRDTRSQRDLFEQLRKSA